MNISVEVMPEQLAFVERLLKSGKYRTRSEYFRDLLRRAEFEWQWKRGIEESKRKGITEDIEAERKAAFRKLKKRFRHVL